MQHRYINLDIWRAEDVTLQVFNINSKKVKHIRNGVLFFRHGNCVDTDEMTTKELTQSNKGHEGIFFRHELPEFAQKKVFNQEL